MIPHLIRNNIKKYYGKAVLIVSVLSISIMATIVVWRLYDNIQWFLMQQSGLYEYESALEIKETWSRAGLIGNKSNIADIPDFSQVLNDPDIQKKYVVSNVNLPIQARVKIAWQVIGTDIIVFAVSDNFFEWYAGASPFPIAISEFMINVYNTQLADETTLPKISKSLIGLAQVELDFGASAIFDIAGYSVVKTWKISKVSGMLPLWFIIPESVAKQALQEANNGTIHPYKVIAVVDDPAKIPVITTRYQNDFVVVSSYDKTKQIQERIVGVKNLFLVINCSILLILVSFLIYTTFSIVEQNQRSFRVFRIHGATPQTILFTLIGQVTIYSLLAGIVSVILVSLGSFILIPSINTMFSQTYGLQYLMQQPTVYVYMTAVISHIILFALLTTIFSWWEWSRKFENK